MSEAALALQTGTYEDDPPKELSLDNRQKIAVQLLSLVRRIAYSLVEHLPSYIKVEDLISAGNVGLMEALAKYDPSVGASPNAFCRHRIGGAMLDYLRSTDAVSKKTRALVKRVAAIIQTAETKFGREPSNDELAAELDVRPDVLECLIAKGRLRPPFILSIEGVDEDQLGTTGEEADQFEHVSRVETRRILAEIIERTHLDEKRKLAFRLRHVEGLSLREIGEQLNVHSTRVHQLLCDVYEKLRVASGGLSFDDLY